MTLNSIMNLICRFICIAYVTVRSYDTSFFKITFFIVIDVVEQFRDVDVCSIWDCKFSEKVLTQFRYKTKIVVSRLQSYAFFITIKDGAH